MIIKGTSVSVAYNRIEEIKKIYYNNENILKPYFNEATVLPVPEDAPPEIPRIIIKTLHEHAQLSITPTVATFQVNYDDGFERNWDACLKYITERMSSVFAFLNLMTDNNYEYIGLVSNVLYDEIVEDGAEKISGVLLNSTKIDGIYDINIKYTFVEKKNMYVNIMLQNARVFDGELDFGKAGALKRVSQSAESVGAIIDINDRWAYNNDYNYKSNSEKLEDLLSCMTNIMNNKLSALIEKGEY